MKRKPRRLEIDEQAVVDLARQNYTVLRLCRAFAAGKWQIEVILARHGLTPLHQQYQTKPRVERPAPDYVGNSLTDEDRRWRMLEGKPNPMAAAKMAWQNRLTDTGGCLKLDGRPIRYDDLIRKTNAVRVEWGMPQLDANEAWVVKIPVDRAGEPR